MSDQTGATPDEVRSYLTDRRNWGRWGEAGSAGAINLITAQKRLEALGLARTGRTVSLSKPLPVDPAPNNPRPVEHYMKMANFADGGGASFDYVGIFPHGYSVTHIDALCHMWDANGMWDGRDPSEEITFHGAKYGSVDQWSGGIITRGVLLDVPRHRGQPYVTLDSPVHGRELEEIARQQGVSVGAGDAVIIFSGATAYAADHADAFVEGTAFPGLHGSCLPFIRDNDIALMGWDMPDAHPNDSGIEMPMHGVIYSYGVAVLDNALLEPLAAACAAEGRYEFLLIVSPLVIVGGTGSAVNPIAVF
jgi:kynurenine formamidase